MIKKTKEPNTVQAETKLAERNKGGQRIGKRKRLGRKEDTRDRGETKVLERENEREGGSERTQCWRKRTQSFSLGENKREEGWLHRETHEVQREKTGEGVGRDRAGEGDTGVGESSLSWSHSARVGRKEKPDWAPGGSSARRSA